VLSIVHDEGHWKKQIRGKERSIRNHRNGRNWEENYTQSLEMISLLPNQPIPTISDCFDIPFPALSQFYLTTHSSLTLTPLYNNPHPLSHVLQNTTLRKAKGLKLQDSLNTKAWLV